VPHRQGNRIDLARTSGKVTVATSSTAVIGNNPARREMTIVNISANIIDLMFATAETSTAPGETTPTAPTAVAGQGLRLIANASWTTNTYTGPVAGIAQTGASDVTVAEF
jgi:hypothetical protein